MEEELKSIQHNEVCGLIDLPERFNQLVVNRYLEPRKILKEKSIATEQDLLLKDSTIEKVLIIPKKT